MGATHAPIAPAKKSARCEPKPVATATAIGAAFPSAANRSARLRSARRKCSGPVRSPAGMVRHESTYGRCAPYRKRGTRRMFESLPSRVREASRGLRPVLRAMRQIPIERGAGDRAALDQAVQALADGEAVCVFPEGKLSRGERLRARSGLARLSEAVPQSRVVLAAISGTTDYVRFQRRPRVAIELFAPPAGADTPQELLDVLRERVPPAPAGRRS